MRITFHINQFHNCEGCIRKVRMALRQLGDVELVELDPERGNFTVATTKHPQVVRHALQTKCKKEVVVLTEQEINPANQNPNSIVPPQGTMIPTQGTINAQDLAEVFQKVSQVEGLDGVEFTNSTTFRLTFQQRENRPDVRPGSRSNILRSGGAHTQDAQLESAPPPPPPRPPVPPPPWPATEPSAPLIPTSEKEVYGYPPEFYGFSATSSLDHHPSGCCAII